MDHRATQPSPATAGKTIEITEVRVALKNQGRLRALCIVNFAGIFVVHGIKVIEGENRLFLAMPSRKEVDGRYRDMCHPICVEFRRVLESRVIGEYLARVAEEERKDGNRR